MGGKRGRSRAEKWVKDDLTRARAKGDEVGHKLKWLHGRMMIELRYVCAVARIIAADAVVFDSVCMANRLEVFQAVVLLAFASLWDDEEGKRLGPSVQVEVAGVGASIRRVYAGHFFGPRPIGFIGGSDFASV